MTKALSLTARLSDTCVTASVAERTIAGVVCEYGAVGNTSWGPTIFERGSITVPDPVAKAKLLVQHDKFSPAVGIMASFTDDPKFPRATYTVPAGDEGDRALVNAANGLQDGLSVGVNVLAYYLDADNVTHIVDSYLYETSLCTIPAFQNAGVTSVAAAHQEGNTMNREQLDAALAAGQITKEEHARQVALLDAAAAPVAPVTAAAGQPVTAPTAPVEAAVPADLGQEHQAGNPAGGITAASEGMSLRAMAQATVDHIKAHGPEGLTAALSDTVPGGDTGKAFLGNKKWVDEVWQVGKARRPLIDTFGVGKLSEDGLEGFAWGVDPTVPQYTGNKDDVHSEVLTWVPKTVEPIRFAGAWDIDRKFIDLGRVGMIEKTYARAVIDYKRKTEVYVRTLVVAAATNDGAKADLITLLTDLGALAQGGADGATAFDLDFVHLAPALYTEFINLPEDDVPWWLKAQGEVNLGTSSGVAGGVSFVSNPGLAARAWLAGDSDAVTYEEFDPPVKAIAENIPQGGIDLGVFGYAAALVNDARGLRKGTVTAPA